MNTTDQAFFAAYGQPISQVSDSPKPTRTRKAPAAKVSPQTTEPSTETQYSDGAWYRMDQQHRNGHGTPAPHIDLPRSPSNAGTESVSVEIGSWSSADNWQSSCVVMAAAIPAELPRQQPTQETAPQVTQQVQDEPPQAVEATEPEQTSDEPDTGTSMAPSSPEWVPQWEVDEFAWPEELERLQAEQSEYFRYAGEKLRDACQEGLKSLAVVATRENEGCTTMAICLARAAAAAGARVALLDANLQHPELGPKLGLDFSHGWQESLNGSTPLAEAAVLALDSQLTLLPLSPTHSLQSLNHPGISELLRQVAAAFDLLIIDTGVALNAQTEFFESGADCPVNAALVVRDLRRTSESETLNTASRLKALGIDAIGIAENFSPRPGNQVAAA